MSDELSDDHQLSSESVAEAGAAHGSSATSAAGASVAHGSGSASPPSVAASS